MSIAWKPESGSSIWTNSELNHMHVQIDVLKGTQLCAIQLQVQHYKLSNYPGTILKNKKTLTLYDSGTQIINRKKVNKSNPL